MREGDRFDNYILQERIAEGGMAEIFRALRLGSLDISREVCIKFIRPSLCADGEFVRMFTDEARIASTLRHGNVVAVDHFGAAEASLFMCTEWVHGVDASQLLDRLNAQGKRMPVDAALFVVSEVLKALEYAHGKIDRGTWLQIVHRDVSPHNVMVSYSGEVKLTDFGIAKATSRLHQTRGEMIKGKLAYMAPEQAVGDALDHRADLFAAGVVAYELLTGRRPFAAETDIEGVQRMLRGERLPLSAHRADVPPGVQAFVDVMLAPDPGDRFIDAGIALDALAEIPALITGARALQRLLRDTFTEEIFSTLPPRLALTVLPQAPRPSARAAPARGSDSTDLAHPFSRPAPTAVRSAGTQPTLLVRRRLSSDDARLVWPSASTSSTITPAPRVRSRLARSKRSRGSWALWLAGLVFAIAATTLGLLSRSENVGSPVARAAVAQPQREALRATLPGAVRAPVSASRTKSASRSRRR